MEISFPILSFVLFVLLPGLVSPEYVRPGTRPLILHSHAGADSDPQQVHISLAGQDYMRVTWITDDKKVKSIVEYGTSTGKYQRSATGTRTWYCYWFYKSGAIHHVKIGPLQPGTTYYYKCGGSGPEFSFRTPPATFPIEFAVAGDLKQTEWTVSTLSHVGAKDYDVFLLPGDLAYADTEQPRWDSFGHLVQPYASTRPWMVTEGNHEIEKSRFMFWMENFRAYNHRWVMPYKESRSSSNLYYSFDVAGAHILMLGSYTDYNTKSKQYKWLKSDLAKVDRTKTPWIFALLHVPWYNSNSLHQQETEDMRKAMEPILYNAQVDVVFTGHVHAYERFTRVYDNKADECGPVHVTIGDGGNRQGLAATFDKPSPSISLYQEASFGHGRLRVVNDTHAHWTWQRNDDDDTVQADEIWIENLSSTTVCKGKRVSSKLMTKDEL